MIRIETKRGCPYNCAFCAHFDKTYRNHVICLNEKRIIEEMKLIKQKNVEEVNIIDPTFNLKNYDSVLKYIIKMQIKSKYKIQSRYELLNEKQMNYSKR
jgi:radical SAM superfamily enzyme YgiQ (UPF0313 family)